MVKNVADFLSVDLDAFPTSFLMCLQRHQMVMHKIVHYSCCLLPLRAGMRDQAFVIACLRHHLAKNRVDQAGRVDSTVCATGYVSKLSSSDPTVYVRRKRATVFPENVTVFHSVSPVRFSALRLP